MRLPAAAASGRSTGRRAGGMAYAGDLKGPVVVASEPIIDGNARDSEGESDDARRVATAAALSEAPAALSRSPREAALDALDQHARALAAAGDGEACLALERARAELLRGRRDTSPHMAPEHRDTKPGNVIDLDARRRGPS